MPTIKDIARAAGVSYTTVSHVLNNSRPVSAKARQSVQDVAKALNYSVICQVFCHWLAREVCQRTGRRV